MSEKTEFELDAIKKLLLVKLIADGVPVITLSKVLGVTAQRIGQLVPIKEIKKKAREN